MVGFVRRMRRVCDDVTHGALSSDCCFSSLALPLFRGGYSELEGLGLGLVGPNRDGCRLCAQALLPGRDLICARVQTRDRELPVGIRDRVERMGEDTKVGAHPGVDVALDVEH